VLDVEAPMEDDRGCQAALGRAPPMKTRWVRLVAPLVLVLACGCTDAKQKMKEREATRAAEKKAQEAAAEAKRKAGQPKFEAAQLEPFWSDPAYLKVATGRPCPEGLWALFPETPGEGAVKEANEKKRPELLEKMRAATFVAVMPFDTGVRLKKYNAKKKKMAVEVDGLIECIDGGGILSLAWGEPAKAFRPRMPKEDDDDYEEGPATPQAVWRAQPLLFPLPFGTAAEAQAFTERRGPGIEVRLVFKLGATAVDKKVQKTKRAYVEDASVQEDDIDWGAGRLVHVELLGVRVATNHENDLLAEQRKKP
jgi:hypothetical protein